MDSYNCSPATSAGVKSGALAAVLKALAKDLYKQGQIDLSEYFIDSTFIIAPKGGAVWAPPSGAKAVRSWQLQTLLIFWSPLMLRVLRRMKSELYSKLSHLDFRSKVPATNHGYDSAKLDAELKEQGIQMIAPYRRNRKKDWRHGIIEFYTATSGIGGSSGIRLATELPTITCQTWA